MGKYLDMLDSMNGGTHTREAKESMTVESIADMVKRELESLPLLPDDQRFIEKRLQAITVMANKRINLLEGYRQQWKESAAGELMESKKENAGRSGANLWLLEVRNIK